VKSQDENKWLKKFQKVWIATIETNQVDLVPIDLLP
jgi:hypothetical protein